MTISAYTVARHLPSAWHPALLVADALPALVRRVSTHAGIADLADSPWAWLNSSINTTSATQNLTMCSVTGLTSGAHVLVYGTAASDPAQYVDVDAATIRGGIESGNNTLNWS